MSRLLPDGDSDGQGDASTWRAVKFSQEA
jgi:hypothetical protein